MKTPASFHGTQAAGLRSRPQRFLTRLALHTLAIVLPLTVLASAASAEIYGLGSRGQRVREIQQALNDRGIKVSVDGDFGRETEAAVTRFQIEQRNLVIDGVAGEDTLYALGLLRDRIPGVPCDAFDASNSTQEAFGKRYRVIVPSQDPQTLISVQSYCRNAYAVANQLGSYIAVGSFADRGTAEGRKNYLRSQGFRDAHVRYF